MEWHFAIKSGRPIKMALVIINFVTEFPNKAKEPVCQKWNGEFRSEYSDRNMRTISGGDPQYSGQKKPKWTFSIEFRPKFLESLVKWKAPYLGYSPVLAVEHSVTWRLGQYLMYKTTNEIRNQRVGERAIAQPLELQMMWIIYEFCYWKVTKWRSSDPLWHNYIPRDIWIFFGINVRVYTKKIQVSRGIFHGIPLESDRRCLTCRNGQITEDVRKIKFDFPTGCQTCFRRIGRTSEDILFKQ